VKAFRVVERLRVKAFQIAPKAFRQVVRNH
jgi:hypothetical protein